MNRTARMRPQRIGRRVQSRIRSEVAARRVGTRAFRAHARAQHARTRETLSTHSAALGAVGVRVYVSRAAPRDP